MLLNLKDLMKISFTQAEVKEIVLEHVWATYPRAMLNTVELDRYSSFEYMVLSFKEPEVAVPATTGELVNE